MAESTSFVPQELEAAPHWVLDIFSSAQPLMDYQDIARVTRMSKGSVANLVSLGRGPTGGLMVGRKRCFPRAEVAKWLWDMADAKESMTSARKGRAA